MKAHQYYVYIMASKQAGILYTGVTNDIARRVQEHKDGIADGFTKKYYIKKLVYAEPFDYIDKAIEREKCIKRWKRDWKIELIEKINPQWKYLYDDIHNWM